MFESEDRTDSLVGTSPSPFDRAPEQKGQTSGSSAPPPPEGSEGGGGGPPPEGDASGVQRQPLSESVAPLVSHWTESARSSSGPGYLQLRASPEAAQDRWDFDSSWAGMEQLGQTQMRSAGGGSPLPAPVQAKMERSFNTDLSAVRVHQGDSAEAMGAVAYAQGTDIHFAPGHYAPDSSSGQELLGHELAHVVQQSQGRVSATVQAKGIALNDDPALEAEADEMGARAARGESAAGPAQTVQRVALRPSQQVRQGYHVVKSKTYGTHEFDAQEAVGGTFLRTRDRGKGLRRGTPRLRTTHSAALRVSQNYQLAIEDTNLAKRQAKAFYVSDPALIAQFNKQLLTAMSHFQLVIDTNDSFQLTSPHGQLTMSRVVPRNIMNDTEGYLGKSKMTLKQKCNENVNQVVGGSTMPVAKGQSAKLDQGAGSRDYDALNRALTGKDEGADLDYVHGGAQKQIAGMVTDYGQKVHARDAGLDNNLRKFELNKHAPSPEIGEGMFTTSLDTFDPTNIQDFANNRTIPQANKNQLWGQHWGGAVATDGGDYITLENYARNNEDAGGDEQADARYYFQMYGTAKDQSWHEQWSAIGHGGREFSNPLSMLVKSTKGPLEWDAAADAHFGGKYATIKSHHYMVSGAADEHDLTAALLKGLVVARAPLNLISSADKRGRALILRSWEDAVRAATSSPKTDPLRGYVLEQIAIHWVDQNTPQMIGGQVFEDLAMRQYGGAIEAVKDSHGEITAATPGLAAVSANELSLALLKGLAYARHHLDDNESGRQGRVDQWIAALNRAPSYPDTDPLLNHVKARMAQVKKAVFIR